MSSQAYRFGNPYAPPWMGFTPVLQGIRDVEWDVDLPPYTVPASTIVSANANNPSLQLSIDGDADFLCREIQFVVTAGASTLPSDLRVRIRDGAGRLFTSDFIPITDLNGPLVPPWPLKHGTVVYFDYQNINGVTAITVWAVLKGWKRTTCAGDTTILQPPYTPMYATYPKPKSDEEFEDFEYGWTFTFAGAAYQPKYPLITDNDADFWWCGLAGDWNTANNDVATVGSVQLVFYDPVSLPMMQTNLQSAWNPSGGLFRESIFSSGGGRPQPHFPAVFIPRGSGPSVDISVGQACTIRFSLRGYKVYPKVCAA